RIQTSSRRRSGVSSGRSTVGGIPRPRAGCSISPPISPCGRRPGEPWHAAVNKLFQRIVGGLVTTVHAYTPRMVQADLRLLLVGRFAVEGADGSALPGGKAMRLLKVLAVNQGRFVPIDELIDILWGADAPARPERNVAALVSRLRRCLGADR